MTVFILVITVLLVCLSWLLSVVGEPVRNLLSPEGIRWIFSNASSGFMNEPFSYFLQFVLMIGAFRASGLTHALGSLLRWPGCIAATYRQRRALFFSGVIALVYVGIILLLVFLPHAVLLSATGNLFPSPFSEGLVWATTTGVMLIALVYGTMSNTLRTFQEVIHVFYAGLEYYAVWIVVAILAAEFYAALDYVFG